MNSFAGSQFHCGLSPGWIISGRLSGGGGHAPILTVNGRIFSQGIVPDIPRLLSTIGKILNDKSLIQLGEAKIAKAASPEKDSEITVYFSPACPHCKQLR